MAKEIKIGATLASFMEGTDFSQSHYSHEEADRIACYDCQELTAGQYAELRAIYQVASNGTSLVATAFQLAELIHVADMCQDTLANTGDFRDAGRAAAVRRSMDLWERLLKDLTA